MKERYCVDCGSSEVVERHRCKEHAKAYNRQRAKDRYKQQGKYSYGTALCSVCGKKMTLWRKDQVAHRSCRYKTVDDYNKVPRDKQGNVFIRGILISYGVDIPKGWIVHHVDENPWNNVAENIWLIPRGAHNSLHRKLQFQRSLWLKNHDSNNEDCWKPIRDHITTAWLETTTAKVIKICDIWQSAAEPLKLKEYLINYEEGSETMHVAPKSIKDMVKI